MVKAWSGVEFSMRAKVPLKTPGTSFYKCYGKSVFFPALDGFPLVFAFPSYTLLSKDAVPPFPLFQVVFDVLSLFTSHELFHYYGACIKVHVFTGGSLFSTNHAVFGHCETGNMLIKVITTCPPRGPPHPKAHPPKSGCLKEQQHGHRHK